MRRGGAPVKATGEYVSCRIRVTDPTVLPDSSCFFCGSVLEPSVTHECSNGVPVANPKPLLMAEDSPPNIIELAETLPRKKKGRVKR